MNYIHAYILAGHRDTGSTPRLSVPDLAEMYRETQYREVASNRPLCSQIGLRSSTFLDAIVVPGDQLNRNAQAGEQAQKESLFGLDKPLHLVEF